MDWDDAAPILDAAVAETFDTATFTVVPLREGASVNHPKMPDGTRAGFDFVGSIDIGPPVVGNRPNLSADPVIEREGVAYEAVVTALDTGWPYVPRRGDQLEHDGVSWSIADLGRDGTPRRVLYVNRAR